MEEMQEAKMQAVESKAKEEADREILRKAMRIRKRKDGKIRTAFYVEEDDLEFMRNNLELADAKSMNEFACKAIRFYIGFLKTQDTEFYQMHSLASLLKAKLNVSDRRINNVLYQPIAQVCFLTMLWSEEARTMSEWERQNFLKDAKEKALELMKLWKKQ